MTKKVHIKLFTDEIIEDFVNVNLMQLMETGYLILSDGRCIGVDEIKEISIDNESKENLYGYNI